MCFCSSAIIGGSIASRRNIGLLRPWKTPLTLFSLAPQIFHPAPPRYPSVAKYGLLWFKEWHY
jgi:hypothetical protein